MCVSSLEKISYQNKFSVTSHITLELWEICFILEQTKLFRVDIKQLLVQIVGKVVKTFLRSKSDALFYCGLLHNSTHIMFVPQKLAYDGSFALIIIVLILRILISYLVIVHPKMKSQLSFTCMIFFFGT